MKIKMGAHTVTPQWIHVFANLLVMLSCITSPTNISLSWDFNDDDFCCLYQEAYITDLDAKSGASLKLTVLNRKGRIWTMVAGGGASVIYRYGTCTCTVLFETSHCIAFSGIVSYVTFP